jgi:thiazole synthase ThiGH ThiG subunit
MAAAFRKGVEAGREAFLVGLHEPTTQAVPTSPLTELFTSHT